MHGILLRLRSAAGRLTQILKVRLSELGRRARDDCSAVNGFSTSQNTDEFVTVLPDSDLAEVEGILENLTKDIQEQGIRQIQAGANKSAASMENTEFVIRAGLAQGRQGQPRQNAAGFLL